MPGNPVVEAVLDSITVPPGAFVVDFACGAGQLGLALAARRPDVSVLGVDHAPGLVERARANAPDNARFEVMSIEDLALEDASADVAVSLFGVLQVGEPGKTVRETARILRPGGVLGLAAYVDMRANPLWSATETVLARHLPPDSLPNPVVQPSLAGPDARERLLHEAGFTSVRTRWFDFPLPLPSFEAAWGLAASPGMFPVLNDNAEVREELREAIVSYEGPGGGS
ncbi:MULTISPECIES: class I SAM-dependent methyltransferase [Amycolatopsis]|uniref:Methyltransferase domain-containing protein n=2 Tax=Amycolatopsis TaxID=1813 RepID=A0A1I3U6T3_9PSEU|nr:class I SAM-dependent methyltransferase [Amycolatopsis sacchari]SFJ78622.1 Methyltransferase domain-containing protein [Amycolatopsis sacchari]